MKKYEMITEYNIDTHHGLAYAYQKKYTFNLLAPRQYK